MSSVLRSLPCAAMKRSSVTRVSLADRTRPVLVSNDMLSQVTLYSRGAWPSRQWSRDALAREDRTRITTPAGPTGLLRRGTGRAILPRAERSTENGELCDRLIPGGRNPDGGFRAGAA